MKKSLLLLSSLLLGIFAFGQHVDLRAYGGFNIMQLTTDEGTTIVDGILHNQTYSGRPGFQFGGAVTFGDQFYFQPGFQFHQSQ